VTALGVARAAPPFTRGVDALRPFQRPELESLIARYAIKVVGAYLEVLTPAYVDLLFGLGLGIAPYSEAVTGAVTAAMGTTTGARVASLALTLGCPASCDLLIDAEDMTGDVPGFVNDRHSAYGAAGGYGSLLYVGLPLPAEVTPDVLQGLLPSRYMRSCSLSCPVPSLRKWCVLQHTPGNFLDPELGIRLDHFTVEQDALGGLPTWWWPE